MNPSHLYKTQLPDTPSVTIPNMKGYDLPAPGIHSYPDSLLASLAPHKTPHPVHFRLKRPDDQCTLLAYWEEGEDEAWFIITDLAPEACDPCCYGMRTWIEESFRITKRGGWQWYRTRMKDPKRAERIWLAISVATIWILSIGGEADASIPENTLPDIYSVDQPKASKPRQVSIFRRGCILILVSLIRHIPLSFGVFIPEPWRGVPLECCRIST